MLSLLKPFSPLSFFYVYTFFVPDLFALTVLKSNKAWFILPCSNLLLFHKSFPIQAGCDYSAGARAVVNGFLTVSVTVLRLPL